MALGDITRDTGSPIIVGNQRVLTGTLEANYVRTAFALMDTASRIIDCFVVSEDGVGAAQVLLNQNAAAVATNGTIAVYANHKDASTYRYRATFV